MSELAKPFSTNIRSGSVDEWISAEAGVGASMASGNHTCEKNWAAFIPPDKTKHDENSVIKCTE